MTFAAGIVAGIVATILVALLVFKARVIAGSARTHPPDLRMAVAVTALVIAIVALVRSGHTSGSQSSSAAGVAPSTAPEPSTTSTSGAPSSTTSTVLTTVTVPNVIGLSQANAVSQLQRSGLRTQVRPLPLGNVVPGFVVEQTPMAFSTTTSGAVVVLSVSSAA